MEENHETPSQTTLYGFDETWYLKEYPDVLGYHGSALEHYLDYGWKEGRQPSAGFDGDAYLAANPDVRESGLCPLLHFLQYGLAEGRTGWEKPNPNG